MWPVREQQKKKVKCTGSNWLVNYCAYINGVRDKFPPIISISPQGAQPQRP